MKKIKSDGVELSLPDELSVPKKSLQDAVGLLYGDKKIGKTTLLSQFPEALFMMFEPGARFIKVYQTTPKTWKEFKAYLKLLKAEPDKFKTLVVDTADQCYKMCFKYVCEKKGFDHPGDETHGKGWDAVSTEFQNTIYDMTRLGRGVWFTSHAEEKEIQIHTGGDKLTRIIPSMAGQARKLLEGLVDITAYYHYRNDKRVITIRGTDHISAGQRIKGRFQGISRINAGNSEEEAYSNLVAAFNTTKVATTKIKIRRP